MAIGSWAKTPLYPGFSEISTMVEARMRAEKTTGQPEDESNEELDVVVEADELDSEEEFFN
jgi:hypothetical protein